MGHRNLGPVLAEIVLFPDGGSTREHLIIKQAEHQVVHVVAVAYSADEGQCWVRR